MKHDHISFKEYTMDNLSLPSNIADLIPRDNMAHVVHEMVERIPMETFLPYYKGGGTSAYHPKMMTKILLYAYTHEQKQKARERLESEEGQARYRQRKTDIESVFGQIKQNRGFRRFVLRGLQKVSIEWGLICAAHNLLKKAARDKQLSLVA